MKNLKFKSMCIISFLAFFVFLESSVNAAEPTVKNTIPNQEANNAQAFDMSVDTYHVFNDADGDSLSIDVKQTDDSNLPAWLTTEVKPMPSLVGTWWNDTVSTFLGISVVDKYAYVASHSSGLKIIDISIPSSPNLIGSLDTSGNAYEVAVAGNHAYVINYVATPGLQIIDVTNPNSPNLVGVYNSSKALGVSVVDNFAYIVDRGTGLEIIDVNNPANPKHEGSLNVLSNKAREITVVGDHAYITDGVAGLRIIDVSIPSSPQLVGTCDELGGNAEGVTVVDNYAYVGNYDEGLQIINISNKASPTLVGSWKTTDTHHVRGVAVVGDLAYVSDGNKGLRIIDVGDKEAPSLVESLDTSGYVNTVDVIGDYAYVADGAAGLKVIGGVAEGIRLSGTPVYEDMGVLDLKATASDGSESISTTFLINVLESTTNNKPTITDQEYKKSQNASLKFNKEQFIAAFQDDDNDELSKIQIMSLPDYGKLKLSGIDVSLNQEIDVGDIDNLSYVPEKDWVGTITFEWRGFDGITYSDEEVVTIKISTDWLGAWWPVITGGTVAVITGVVTVAGGVTLWLCRRQLAKCCCNNDLDGSSRDTQLKTIEKDELSD